MVFNGHILPYLTGHVKGVGELILGDHRGLHALEQRLSVAQAELFHIGDRAAAAKVLLDNALAGAAAKVGVGTVRAGGAVAPAGNTSDSDIGHYKSFVLCVLPGPACGNFGEQVYDDVVLPEQKLLVRVEVIRNYGEVKAFYGMELSNIEVTVCHELSKGREAGVGLDLVQPYLTRAVSDCVDPFLCKELAGGQELRLCYSGQRSSFPHVDVILEPVIKICKSKKILVPQEAFVRAHVCVPWSCHGHLTLWVGCFYFKIHFCNLSNFLSREERRKMFQFDL